MIAHGMAGLILYGELAVFDVRPAQPEIHLHIVRFDAATSVQSMVKYIEFSNVFRAVDSSQLVSPSRRDGELRDVLADQYLIFIADNALLVEVSASEQTTIRINRIQVESEPRSHPECRPPVPWSHQGSSGVIRGHQGSSGP